MSQIYINFRAKIHKRSADYLISIIGQALQQKKDKINLLISSPGGEVQPSIDLYDYIKGLPEKIEINTYGLGQVYSGAVLIYCSGKNRSAHPRSKFLIHGVRIHAPKNTIKQLEEKIIPEVKKSSDQIAQIIIETTGRKKEEAEKDLRGETELSVKEAKNYGLINGEITERFIKETGVPVITIGDHMFQDKRP